MAAKSPNCRFLAARRMSAFARRKIKSKTVFEISRDEGNPITLFYGPTRADVGSSVPKGFQERSCTRIIKDSTFSGPNSQDDFLLMWC
jgi:hypothetical protein